MKYVVAVSGGVDSVVLLDMLVKKGEDELIVAHFDHGIRPESDADARFVKALATSYGLPFETKREELGESASEELARERRYEFLRGVAKKNEAELVTAHHYEDTIESIAINIIRGTGWRGLAVMSGNIVRPLLSTSKNQLYEYALKHNLEWVQDETNHSKKYLRNRLRGKLRNELLAAHKVRLRALWQDQLELRRKITIELDEIISHQSILSRYFFSNIDETSAIELLKAVIENMGASLTRPQLRRALHAIKTLKPGSVFEAGAGVKLEFSQREFVVKTE